MHCSWVRVSYILGWPWTHCVAKDALLVPCLCLPTLGLQMRILPYFSNPFFFFSQIFSTCPSKSGSNYRKLFTVHLHMTKGSFRLPQIQVIIFFSSTSRCTNVEFYRCNLVITDLNSLCLDSRATHWKLGFLILNHFNLEHVRMIQIKVMCSDTPSGP